VYYAVVRLNNCSEAWKQKTSSLDVGESDIDGKESGQGDSDAGFPRASQSTSSCLLVKRETSGP
jgi:hypothetical protein